MDTVRFNQLTKDFFRHCEEVLGVKAGEYAQQGDRLSNFKRAAALQESEPEMSLQGMATKHIVSIFDFIDELNNDAKHRSLEVWKEKLTDVVNYLGPLLWALLCERYE